MEKLKKRIEIITSSSNPYLQQEDENGNPIPFLLLPYAKLQIPIEKTKK